jgi:hypothetical protein
MKSYNEIVQLVESNPSQAELLSMPMDDSSKVVALSLIGLNDLAREFAKNLEKTEKKEALLSYAETKQEHLFLDSDLDMAFSMHKAGRNDIAAKIIELAQESLDQKQYVTKFSELTGITKIVGSFDFKDQIFQIEGEPANLVNLFKIPTQLDETNEGIQFLLNNSEDGEKAVPVVAQFESGSFKIKMEDKFADSGVVKKIIAKKLINFKEGFNDFIKDKEKIASYAVAASVIVGLLATGVSYGNMMKKINDGSFSNNVKSLVDHHVEVQHQIME